MLKIIEHNTETNEIIEREMTAKEIEANEAIDAQFIKEVDKLAARQAVLDKLKLSADEVAALLG
jgi:hypothetical protein